MARRKYIGIREQLTSLIPPQKLGRPAKDSGFRQRRRKVAPVQFFWTVVLGFGAGKERTIAGLRRLYRELTGQTLVPSAFYDRFSGCLVRFLKAVLAELLASIGRSTPKYAGILTRFADVLVVDATIIRLHKLLEKSFPSCWTNHTKAAAKLNMVICVKDASPRTIRVTEGRRHECKNFRVGKWVQGRLLLFDLGFFRYQLFDCIDRNRGYFISRLKDNANPTITRAYRRWRGRSVPVEGERLRDIEQRLKRQELDVEVEVSFPRRMYNGKRTRKHRKLRLVGVRNEETGRYHFYVTNIPAEDLAAHEIARAYEVRWQVELVFSELKTHYRLDQLQTSKRAIVESLLHASVVTLIAGRQLLMAVRRKLQQDVRVPHLRWGALFSQVSGAILKVVAGPLATARPVARWLEPMILHEAADPNKGRQLLVDRVEYGATC